MNPMNRTERRRGAEQKAKPQGDRRRLLVYGTIGLLAVLVIAVFAFNSRTPKTASDAPVMADIKVGQTAPAFGVSTTSGPFSLPVTDKKPVLVEVFATWCPHCQHETSVLNSLFDKYKDRVHIVAVSGSPYAVDGSSPASQADVVGFAEHFKVRYPIAYDGEMDVAKKYLQGGFPTMVVIDPSDKISSIRDGEISEKQLTGDLDKALKG